MYNTPLPGLLSIYRVKMSSVQIPVKYGLPELLNPSTPFVRSHPFDRLLFVVRACGTPRAGKIECSRLEKRITKEPRNVLLECICSWLCARRDPTEFEDIRECFYYMLREIGVGLE